MWGDPKPVVGFRTGFKGFQPLPTPQKIITSPQSPPQAPQCPPSPSPFLDAWICPPFTFSSGLSTSRSCMPRTEQKCWAFSQELTVLE